MCGIAGIVAWDDRYRVTRETLERMSARIAHRGPDGSGLYLNHEDEVSPDRPQAGFVHRRLAIIDPDPRADQPFTDGHGRWVTFNGEIYNYRELRAELKSLKPDYVWRTDCDTEALLVAYDAWGDRCVERLNGMFAFAVWDGPKRELFLARDRMGQKPLYYRYDRDARVAFASEPGALDVVRTGAAPVYREGLVHYLQYGYRETLGVTGDVDELGPGVVVTFRARAEGATPRVTGPERRYFDCNATPDDRAADERPAAARARELVARAVRRQLVSDVPLGVFLSGGVDSSVVAACARRAAGTVATFSIAFDDPRYDESAHARAVAKHLGTAHHEFRVRMDAVDDLPKLAAVFGEPFADSSALPTLHLARQTRRHVKVALSGDGGDELFGGYDRYRAMRLARRLAILKPVSPIGTLLARGHPKARATRAGRLLASLALPAGARYESFVRLFDDRTIHVLLPGLPFGISPLVGGTYAALRASGRDAVAAALATDRVTYLPGDLLTKVDRASMLHALEVRSPFMDHELVQFAAGLTTDQLLKGGPKRMLREAFADDLPAWVFKRKKMGFAVPIGDWFRDRRGPVRAMLHDHLFAAGAFGASHFHMPVVRRLVDEHESGRADHAQRLYALLMLELWWRTQRG